MGTWKAETDNHLPSLLRKTKLVSDQDILLISKKSIFSCIIFTHPKHYNNANCFLNLGALVANLTILQRQRQGDPGFVEYIITNAEANEKFTISENGLLHTKVRYFPL